MNRVVVLVSVLTAAVLAGCSGHGTTSPGAAGAAAGDAGPEADVARDGDLDTALPDAGPAMVSCSDMAHEVVGVRVDRAQGCLKTEESATVVACGDDASAPGLFYSTCVEQTATGERYWITTPRLPALAPGWTWCSDFAAQPPPACFIGQCPDDKYGAPGYPASSCTEADTRTLYDCGGDSSWDEHCCRRPFCNIDADCAPGLQCRYVTDQWYFLAAWPYKAGTWLYENQSAGGCDHDGVQDALTMKKVCIAPGCPADHQCCVTQNSTVCLAPDETAYCEGPCPAG